jgi:2,4-dienoyl-CoA reductase-like NADH-dependent reductase (Old Yellow Enzyme family)
MAPLTRTRAQNPGTGPNELMAEYDAQRARAGLIAAADKEVRGDTMAERTSDASIFATIGG